MFELPVKMVEKVTSGAGAEAGRPKKRLSDNPGAKTENKILDSMIQEIEDAAREQNIAPRLLLEKLVQRSYVKWGSEEPTTTKDVSVAV